METIKLKGELHSFIDQEDDQSVKDLYQIVKAYTHQKRIDKMIADGEEDIKNGNFIA